MFFVCVLFFSLVRRAYPIRIALSHYIGDLNPNKGEPRSFPILYNIYDPLIRYSLGELRSGAATKWSIDGNSVTFYINSKAYDGSDISPQDFVLRLKDILDNSPFSNRYYVIKNAKRYSNGEISFDEVGIEAKCNLLTITFEEDFSFDKYGSILAFTAFVPFKENGPFHIVKKYSDRVLLKRNEYYNSGNIDEVEFITIKYDEVAKDLFEKGEIDIILNLPYIYKDIGKEYSLNNIVYYLSFNVDKVPLEVRGYLSNKIDKNLFNSDNFSLDISKTDYLVPNFNSLPISKRDGLLNRKLSFLVSSNKLDTILSYILESIGINIDKVPAFVKKEKVEKKDYEIVLSSWQSDNNNLPFDYMTQFLSDSDDNFTNYKSEKFDKLYKLALSSKEIDDSLNYLKEAEKVLLEDFVVLPLFNKKKYYAIQENLKDIDLSSGSSILDLRRGKIES